MKDTANRLLYCAVFWTLLYFGFIKGVEGAANVVTFYVWAMVFLSPFLVFTDLGKRPKQAPPGRVMKNLLGTTRWSALLLFIWTGSALTAGAWIVVMLMIAAYEQKRAQEAAAS